MSATKWRSYSEILIMFLLHMAHAHEDPPTCIGKTRAAMHVPGVVKHEDVVFPPLRAVGPRLSQVSYFLQHVIRKRRPVTQRRGVVMLRVGLSGLAVVVNQQRVTERSLATPLGGNNTKRLKQAFQGIAIELSFELLPGWQSGLDHIQLDHRGIFGINTESCHPTFGSRAPTPLQDRIVNKLENSGGQRIN